MLVAVKQRIIYDISSQTHALLVNPFTCENLEGTWIYKMCGYGWIRYEWVRESSFNMTSGGDEDIETQSLKF